MLKKSIVAVLVLAAAFCAVLTENASAEAQIITTAQQLMTALGSNGGGEYILGADITPTTSNNYFYARKEIDIDLNGHTINLGTKRIFPLQDITIRDGSEAKTGTITLDAKDYILCTSASYPVTVTLESGTLKNTNNNTYGVRITKESKFVMNGGKIESDRFTLYVEGEAEINDGYIVASNNATVQVKGGSLEVNGGTIEALGDHSAINLHSDCEAVINGGKIIAKYENNKDGGTGITAFKNTKLTINDGEFDTYSFNLAGNGSGPGENNDGSNAKFYINGGTFKSKLVNLYVPQRNGETIIAGGTFTAVEENIEIRAGNVQITGGEFTATMDEFLIDSNTNGTNIKGASVSVVQHTTHQPINLTICGGIYHAVVPFYEKNINGNSQADIEKIYVEIIESCGELAFYTTDTSSSAKVVESEDISNFISGGKYSKMLGENYIADGYKQKSRSNMYIVAKWFSITTEEVQGGSIAVDYDEGYGGEEISIAAIPADGYELETITAKDADGNDITVKNGKFTMPAKAVTITAKFKQVPIEPNATDVTENPSTLDGVTVWLAIMSVSLTGICATAIVKKI